MSFAGNGTIEFAEFITVMTRVLDQENTSEDDLITIFRIMDQDGDGYITKSDLRECCVRIGSQLTHRDLDEMLSEADKDGDGQIDFEGKFNHIFQSGYLKCASCLYFSEFVKILETRE